MLEAAVIAIPHPKWDERPLLIVVPDPAGPPPTPEDVLAFMQVGTHKSSVWPAWQSAGTSEHNSG